MRFLRGGDDPSPEVASGSAGTPDLDAVKKDIAKSRRRQSKLVDEAEQAKQSAQLEALYAPENFERVATLYTDIRFAWTGSEIFKLGDKERIILSHSLSAVAQTYGGIPPGILSVIIFSANFIGIVGEKEASYYLDRKRKRAAATAQARH